MKYINLDKSNNDFYWLEPTNEVILKSNFQQLQELYNEFFFRVVWGYQTYYNTFSNDNFLIFFNEKSLIHIIFDFKANKIFFIDCNSEDIDSEKILIEELRKNNFSNQDICDILELSEY